MHISQNVFCSSTITDEKEKQVDTMCCLKHVYMIHYQVHRLVSVSPEQEVKVPEHPIIRSNYFQQGRCWYLQLIIYSGNWMEPVQTTHIAINRAQLATLNLGVFFSFFFSFLSEVHLSKVGKRY